MSLSAIDVPSKKSELLKRFEMAVSHFDTTDPAIKSAVDEARQECIERLESDETLEFLHDIDFDEGNEALNTLIGNYIRLTHTERMAERAEKAKVIAESRISLDTKLLHQVVEHHYCLDSDRGWTVNPYLRCVIADKEDEEQDGEDSRKNAEEFYRSIKDSISLYQGEVGTSELLKAGVVPKELKSAVAYSSNFALDLVVWMEVSGEPGVNMVRQIDNDTKYAVSIVKHQEMFAKPVHALAVLHLKLLRDPNHH
ncbi:MAG: hypothetical protein JAZ15_03225 [Candidatus Thiodiazotropha endolucinida]|nr:hypothetical protein [Candidatus Thiodiazotropha taylori]MCW4312006.1 hypothetical protein [Candidatus Thiodiazotropha taylori]